MHTPQTSAALSFFMDPSRKFVLFNTGAYGTASSSTLQVQSVINRATEKAIIQNTSANQPTWSGSVLDSQYVLGSATDTAAQVSAAPSMGEAGITFNGTTQYLEYDTLGAQFTDASALTVTCVVGFTNTGSAAGNIWSFGSAGANPYLALSVSSTTVSLTEYNSTALTATISNTPGSYIYVITAIKTSTSLTLRVNNAVSSTGTIATTSTPYTTFVMGASNYSSGTIANYFNGSIGKVLVWPGNADCYQTEVELMLRAGIIRGATQGNATVSANQGF